MKQAHTALKHCNKQNAVPNATSVSNLVASDQSSGLTENVVNVCLPEWCSIQYKYCIWKCCMFLQALKKDKNTSRRFSVERSALQLKNCQVATLQHQYLCSEGVLSEQNLGRHAWNSPVVNISPAHSHLWLSCVKVALWCNGWKEKIAQKKWKQSIQPVQRGLHICVCPSLRVFIELFDVLWRRWQKCYAYTLVCKPFVGATRVCERVGKSFHCICSRASLLPSPLNILARRLLLSMIYSSLSLQSPSDHFIFL